MSCTTIKGHQPNRSTVVLGEFDGFHRGHRRLMEAARALAKRNREPLTAVVLDYEARDERLMEPGSRAVSALRQGATSAHVLSVPAGRIPEITNLVVESIHEITSPTQVVMACSPLTTQTLEWNPSMAFALQQNGTPVVRIERARSRSGEVTTGAVIRELNDGDVRRASQMLGRPPGLGGVVIRGAGLGRTLGFATANLVPPERQVIPGPGVYAAVVSRDGCRHMAAVNIGRRPTVEANGRLLIEAHLLDFDDDLYGQHLELEFHSRLRAEMRFDGLDQLVAQLGKDVEAVRQVFRSGIDASARQQLPE